MILAGTPPWVWAVLALLVFLGWRRLKPRRTRLEVAAIAPAAFLIWSLAAAAGLAGAAGIGLTAGVWAAAFALGAASFRLRIGERPSQLPDGRFLFPATPVPLIVYAGIFILRYALGIAAPFHPDLTTELGLVGLAVSALTAGRFVADFLVLLRSAKTVADPA